MEIQEFKSLGEFSAWLESHEPAGAFVGYDCSSERTGHGDWYGTESWGDAQRLLLEGDSDSFKQLEAARVPAPRGGGKTAVIKSGPVGFAPNVPAYLAGRPDSMLRTVNQAGAVPVIEVLYNVGACCGVEPEQISKTANVVFNAIKKIEESGRSVRLYVTWGTKEGGESYGFRVLAKDANERISCYKLAYCVINPSFLRRHCFRWLERRGVRNRGFVSGYGSPEKTDPNELNYYSCTGLTVDEVVKKILG